MSETPANADDTATYTCPVCGWTGLYLQRAIEAHRDAPTYHCLGKCGPMRIRRDPPADFLPPSDPRPMEEYYRDCEEADRAALPLHFKH